MKVCSGGRNGHGGLAILEIGVAELASAAAAEGAEAAEAQETARDRKLDRQEAITAGTNEGDCRRTNGWSWKLKS